jgi:type I restriction enzyme, S subunit
MSGPACSVPRREIQMVLASAFREAIAGAPRIPMSAVAPIKRRPVQIEPSGIYPELGVRSFGRGLFEKPNIIGSEVAWQKLFRIHAGDIVFSNIKAWEGAFAVAREWSITAEWVRIAI